MLIEITSQVNDILKNQLGFWGILVHLQSYYIYSNIRYFDSVKKLASSRYSKSSFTYYTLFYFYTLQDTLIFLEFLRKFMCIRMPDAPPYFKLLEFMIDAGILLVSSMKNKRVLWMKVLYVIENVVRPQAQ